MVVPFLPAAADTGMEHERTGLLCNPDDVDDFCHQAKRLIEQEDLRRELGRLHGDAV